MKRIVSILIAFLVLFAAAAPAYAYIAGDTDNDFVVTPADARFALRLSVKLEKCDPASDQYKAADADGDGVVTSSDARTILRVSVGLEDFPDNTARYGSLVVTRMPYQTNGLTVNKLTFKDNNYLTLNVTNNTGRKNEAVSGNSYIPYKFYNARGNVIYSGSVGMMQMNPGESCDVSILIRSGAAKLIFGAATVKFVDAVTVTQTTVISGITVSKAPFTVSGFRVGSIAIDAERRHMDLSMENNTGKAASCSVTFICYDAAGNSKGSISVSSGRLNAGEKSRNYTIYPTGTTKIIFSKVSVTDRDAFTPLTSATAVVGGVTATKTPVSSQGITVTVTEITDRKNMTLKITNKTGGAVSSSSRLEYKTYDAEGYVLEVSSTAILDLNNGESCLKEISLSRDTARVLLGAVSVVKGTPLSAGSVATIDGIVTNAKPLNLNGLQISEFKVEKRWSSYTDVSVKLTNNTGKAVSTGTDFQYKALTDDDVVLKSGSGSLPCDLNSGEYCHKTISFPAGTGKIYFFTGKISAGNVFPESASYTALGGLRITKAPHANNGLSVTSYQIRDGKLALVIKNNTGVTVKSISGLYYKVTDGSGEVLKTSEVFCEEMNAGESCEVSFYLPDGAQKITFGDFKVYKK